jgi:5-formyltetrahydrofolate cyclo-ligase
MDKKQLREYAKKMRDDLSYEDKSIRDEAIYLKVISDPVYIAAKVVFIFVSFGSEVNTHCIIKHALKNNKVVCVPKVINKSEGMKAIRILNFEDLKQGVFGVLEPISFENHVEADKIDLAVIPGLAFDLRGGRIGYGAGYYDRFLKKMERDALKMGVCYKSQLIENVPMNEHDIFIDKLITE